VNAGWGALTRCAALIAGGALRIVPRRMRFRVVVSLARVIAPMFVALLSMARYRGPIAGRVDATVRVLCRAMTAAGTRFDPEVRYDGPESLAGALLISGHFPLNALVTRSLFDRGMPPVIVKRFPLADPYYWGSFVRDDVIEPSSTSLVKVRSALAEGRPVFIDIDSSDEVRRGVTADMAYGTVNVSTAVFDFARRSNAPLYFACGRNERSGLPRVIVRRIEPEVEEFLAHYREEGALIV
jgi:hypothetical protein